jgi:hypothetical protein
MVAIDNIFNEDVLKTNEIVTLIEHGMWTEAMKELYDLLPIHMAYISVAVYRRFRVENKKMTAKAFFHRLEENAQRD